MEIVSSFCAQSCELHNPLIVMHPFQHKNNTSTPNIAYAIVNYPPPFLGAAGNWVVGGIETERGSRATSHACLQQCRGSRPRRREEKEGKREEEGRDANTLNMRPLHRETLVKWPSDGELFGETHKNVLASCIVKYPFQICAFFSIRFIILFTF